MHREIITPSPFKRSLSKFSCAIERINDPHPISIQAFNAVCCLFGEHAISWESLRECRGDSRLGSSISSTPQGRIVKPLSPADRLVGSRAQLEQDASGFGRNLARG
jgi:hypothetical protein